MNPWTCVPGETVVAAASFLPSAPVEADSFVVPSAAFQPATFHRALHPDPIVMTKLTVAAAAAAAAAAALSKLLWPSPRRHRRLPRQL